MPHPSLFDLVLMPRSYIQSVANDPKLHGVIFLCLDLDGEDDEATAGERFGVSTLPQLVIYNGIIGPSGKLGRRRASVTDVPSVRSALKRFFGDKLRMDQFDLAASLEGAGLQ